MGRWRKACAVLAVCLGSVALVLTQSRGAGVAFGLSGVIFFVAVWSRGWVSAKVPLAIALGALLTFLPVYRILVSRIETNDKGSAASRVPLIEMGMRVIAEHPALGVGAGNCHLAVLQEAGRLGYRSAWLYTVHNKYILVGVETGLVGLVFFLSFLSHTIRQGWRGWRLGDRILSPIALTLVAAIFGQMAHMLVEIFKAGRRWKACGAVRAWPRPSAV